MEPQAPEVRHTHETRRPPSDLRRPDTNRVDNDLRRPDTNRVDSADDPGSDGSYDDDFETVPDEATLREIRARHSELTVNV